MNDRSVPTELREVATGQLVAAWVVHGVAVDEFRRVAERWHESKATFRREVRQARADLPANDSWDWEDKAATTTPGFHRFLGVMTDEIQGMMMLATVPQSSRKPGREGDPLTYIEYLESAPWNLPEYVGRNTRYRGVGFSLLNAAVAVSVELGCGGRLGLHSLPERVRFTRGPGFNELALTHPRILIGSN